MDPPLVQVIQKYANPNVMAGLDPAIHENAVSGDQAIDNVI
jgi:hypothetical protein